MNNDFLEGITWKERIIGLYEYVEISNLHEEFAKKIEENLTEIFRKKNM